MEAVLAAMAERVQAAAARGTPLCIRGGGTKDFYGNAAHGEVLDPRPLQGVIAYEPSELVVTARAGTLLAGLEQLLASEQQMLCFEPPHFGPEATLGGCVAAGLSGPRRAAAGVTQGGVRDFVLGAKLLDGRGQLLSFGGTVMKNVAGYDVARLLAGSLGVLGVITEVSLKVLPIAAAECSLQFEMDQESALRALNSWGALPLPVSASCWVAGVLTLRLAGAAAAVREAQSRLGGERVESGAAAAFWRSVREQTHPWFAGAAPLWRLSVPSSAPALGLAGEPMIEWGGALRWSRSTEPAALIRERAQACGGHATLFRGGERAVGAFTPLSPALAAIHRRLKSVFDPAGIFNRGRMFADL